MNFLKKIIILLDILEASKISDLFLDMIYSSPLDDFNFFAILYKNI